ncbi:MAG: hypothetical protein ACYC6K_06710 [Bellilinea sp.]
MIPYGRKYKVKMEGYRWKFVECSFCECKYLYRMKRKVEGEGASLLWLDNTGAKKRAGDRANDELDYKLRNEIDSVSCPECGMYQKDMIKKIKIDEWESVGCWSFFLGVIGVVIVLIGNSNLDTAPVWLRYFLMIALIVLWLWLEIKMAINAIRLKPNSNAQERIGQVYSEKYPVLRLSEWEEIYGDIRQ